MRLLSTLALGLVGIAAAETTTSTPSTPSTAPNGHGRDYDANDYYVLHLDDDVAPEQVAARLDLVHEGTLGELLGHHIFSGAKSTQDVVKRELQQRKRRRRDLGVFGAGASVLDGVRFAQKQTVRPPWEKRILPRDHGAATTSKKRAIGTSQAVGKGGAHPEAIEERTRVTSTLGIADPIFNDQWHLFNTVELGHDVNVTGAWLDGITGKNTTVAIVDDGLDMYSNDLKANYYAQGSFDFNDNTTEPRPRLSDDRHGTRCAGEVAAARNDVCGVGVAYDARIAGIRILSKAISDADEALAMNYDMQNNQIYSCSWGPPDDGKSMDAPGILIRRAMLNAVQRGRGGLGSVYVFASGNGAAADDNCNFDGYTNSIYSITVGAVDRHGDHPYYSEKCSAGMVVTYSSGGGDAIHTTDVGQNSCYENHGGTSAAAPLAAGIFALALQVRPDLSWRDMQYLAMMTAVPLHLDDGEWQDTFIGKKYSHTYSYGKLDTYGLVEAARTWKNVKPQAWYYSPWVHVKKPIPEGDVGLTVDLEITEEMLKEANLERVEHVTLTMNVEHTRRGDLSVDLVSPNKVVSHMATARRLDTARQGYLDWTFMSVAHWGESGVGKWTVIIKDTIENAHNGTFTDFHIKLWGESIDAAKAKLLPMPEDSDDADHAATATTTRPVSTTTYKSSSSSSSSFSSTTVEAVVTDKPSGHPDRPVKPTAAATSAAASAESAASATSAGSPKPTTPTSSNSTATEYEGEEASATATHSSWIPSFLSNLSTKTQIWIYGALGLIAAFCLGLGVFLYLARRRRIRNNTRDTYEFELIDDEEAEALNSVSAEKGRAGAHGVVGGAFNKNKKRRKLRRGGELYDAFAEGSSDDDFDDDEDDEDVYNDSEGQSSGQHDGVTSSDDDEQHHPRRNRPSATAVYRDVSSEEHLAAAAAPETRTTSGGIGSIVEEPQHVIGDDSESSDSEDEARGKGDKARLI